MAEKLIVRARCVPGPACAAMASSVASAAGEKALALPMARSAPSRACDCSRTDACRFAVKLSMATRAATPALTAATSSAMRRGDRLSRQARRAANGRALMRRRCPRRPCRRSRRRMRPRARGQGLVVGDEDEGGARLAVELGHELDDAGAGGAVEVARRLVREEHPRLVAERAGEGDPLLLAARELRGVVVAAVAQSHPLQQLVGAEARIEAAQLEGDLDVLPRGQGGDEVEGLEDEADLLRAQPRPRVLAQRAELDAVEEDAPAGGPVEAGHQREQRALAAARRAEDGHVRAGRARAA